MWILVQAEFNIVCVQTTRKRSLCRRWMSIFQIASFLFSLTRMRCMNEYLVETKKQNYRKTHISHMSTVFLSIIVPLFCAVSWDHSSCGYINKTARFNNHYSTLKNRNSVYKLDCIVHYFSSILKILMFIFDKLLARIRWMILKSLVF